MAKIRIVLNGFGRIGRTVLRQLLTVPANSDIEVVAINDIADLDTCTYLFKYDSVYGPCPLEVQAGDDALIVGDHSIPLWNKPDLAQADLTAVDVVLECTGRATLREFAQAGITAGAKAVLISGPSPAADVTVVMGANDDALGDAQIVSNASCTTNAIAPLLQSIDQSLGIEMAHITTIHCYTGSQPTVDVPGPSLERSRAAAVSMIPTTTSAAGQITQVLPSFNERLSVSAVRVPSLSVSAVDAVLQIKQGQSKNLAELAQDICEHSPVMGVTHDACVSTDMRARSESFVLSSRESVALGDRQLRLFGWYDNEWGFSSRMIDMTRRIAKRK